MKLNAVNNAPSFGMAWNKGAKEILSKSVAGLSKQQQPEAIKIINNLENNSPYHMLNCMEDAVIAIKNTSAGSSFSEYSNNGFFKKLQKLDKFITQENKIIPIIHKTADKLTKPLNFLTEKGIFESGLRINESDLPNLTTSLVATSIRKGEKPNSTKIVETIKSINKKAEKNNFEILLKIFNRGYSIRKKGTHIVGNNHQLNTLETFDEINKTMDKLIKKSKKADAKETKKYKDDIKKITQAIKRREFIQKIQNKINSSKIIQTLNKIKETILAPVHKVQNAKLQRIQAATEEVSKQLEI